MKSLRHVTSPTVRASWRGAGSSSLIVVPGFFFPFKVHLARLDCCRV